MEIRRRELRHAHAVAGGPQAPGDVVRGRALARCPDRPVAVVRGPAVLDAGYCGPDSNRAFAGFTQQPLNAWIGALGTTDGIERETVGSATISRAEVDVDDPGGPCGTQQVEVAMLEAGAVRVVLVQDAGALPAGDVRNVLLSLELP